jgi:ketosteroid isomerase-like protein
MPLRPWGWRANAVSLENVAILEAYQRPSDTNWAEFVHDDAAWEAAADAMAPFVHTEMVTRIGVGMGKATRTYLGRHGVRQAFGEWLGPFEEYYIAVLETIDCGDRVLRLTEHTGRLRGSTSTLTMHAGDLWTFRDGVIVSLESYPDHAEARRAAGLGS